MALDDTYNITRPGQAAGTGDIDALHIEEYTGVVEATIERHSALQGFVPMRSVKGTSVFTNFAVGQSTLQKVVPGAKPDGTVNKFGKKSLTVDTIVLARSSFPLLETWQTSYDARKEVGQEHGKTIGKFVDQSFFIQAIKAGSLTQTPYSIGAGAGHLGASQVTLTNSTDAVDPVLLYQAISDLFVQMRLKDVDPAKDDVMIVVKPQEFATLQQNDQIINREYITSEGVSIQAHILKAYGCPVIDSNNFPGGEVIASHFLSNSDNGNAYDGDFSKVVAAAFSPRALMAGSTIPLTTKMYWLDEYLQWNVDAYLSYAVGPNRPEFAGLILKP